MAKNLDVNIDAGDFLDSFRPELPPPASPSAAAGAGPEKKTETGEKKNDGRVRAENKKTSANDSRKETKSLEDEYLELFIRNAATAARDGKLTYVRKEYHDRIMKIIQVIGKNGLSLAGYIDHVLTQHFELYEEAVKKLYKKNYEDIF
ncbi:DUF3408 domain-containing protein [Bacteroides sp.]|uniref:DUF3408 domain-containing protein n=1 Tax=Bacteroides sp. TaxID=29523 RepID=UPI003AB878DB